MQTTNQTPEREGQEQLIPFLWLRKGIGLLGFFFPVLLVVGSKLFGNCNKLLGSISDYYHTNMDDVFVAVLCVIGIFLFICLGHCLFSHIHKTGKLKLSFLYGKNISWFT
jgi:hypothetical protein